MLNKSLIFVLLLIFVVSGFYQHNRIEDVSYRVNNLTQKSNALDTAVAEGLLKIEEEANEKQREIAQAISSDLNQAIYEKVQSFKSELSSITLEIEKEELRLAKLRNERVRAENGFPELIELDDLYAYYNAKPGVNSTSEISAFTSNSMTAEIFQTQRGEIKFSSADIETAVVPSNSKAAWVRIGKNPSSLPLISKDNAELIHAFLDESSQAKVQQGYVLVSDETNPADYGEYTEKLYKKGDMYFKTYFQYERVQGTYDRHSHQYTYYVETGSSSRKEQYQLEQYNSKLGS